MQQLTNNVFTETKIRGCNPSIVFTSEGSVFIDTAQWITTLLEMRKFAHERGPIRYLINTEPHIDHIFGNHWFAGECPVIGHENLAKSFWKIPPAFNQTTYDYSVDIIKRQDPDGLKDMPSEQDYVINTPQITFSDRMTLKVGDHTFCLYYAPGHSDANIIIYVPEEKTAFVGDTIFNGCQIWLHSVMPDELFKTLDFLAKLDVDYIVPGHGPVCDKSAIYENKKFLYDWYSAVADGIAKGWTKEECVKNISFADRCPVDIGQADAMDYIQEHNAMMAYDYVMNKL
ncbi:MAG: MBL fold metallo-hydrolase [Lachnospiraceae bacterium]|jgi:glyoxylase-like metal-dependent hydrolase (beta-lactamase superfamily II)|nr:MBL fold metallo-hydrolase [Lachnospiraceae bacterium]MCI1329228.1 MBL fold metallo-hydrolase [Lachnospiraceae bacterium]